MEMFKQIFFMLLPFLKPAICKLIDALVKIAEEKYTAYKAGKDKKAFVLKQIDAYFKAHPEQFNKLKEKFQDKLPHPR